MVTCVRCAIAYCIGSSLGPGHYAGFDTATAPRRRHRDVHIRRHTEQTCELSIRGDEPAIRVVRDGDRHLRAGNEIRERTKPCAELLRRGVVRRLEYRGEARDGGLQEG
jgi:hypothetical protein